MRAIKIDVIKKEIYEVDISGNNRSMNKEIEGNGFDMVRISKSEALWVDDEGLRRKPPLGAFTIKWYPQALPGHGLIIGLRGPENTDTRLTLEEVKEMVRFVDISELPLPVITIHSFEKAEDFERYMRGESTSEVKASKN